jgi:hypothetical protein
MEKKKQLCFLFLRPLAAWARVPLAGGGQASLLSVVGSQYHYLLPLLSHGRRLRAAPGVPRVPGVRGGAALEGYAETVIRGSLGADAADGVDRRARRPSGGHRPYAPAGPARARQAEVHGEHH